MSLSSVSKLNSGNWLSFKREFSVAAAGQFPAAWKFTLSKMLDDQHTLAGDRCCYIKMREKLLQGPVDPKDDALKDLALDLVSGSSSFINYDGTEVERATIAKRSEVLSLVNKGFDRSAHESMLAHGYLVGLDAESYGDHMRIAMKEARLKEKLTLSEAMEMVRNWTELDRNLGHVVNQSGGAKGGSTTANTATSKKTKTKAKGDETEGSADVSTTACIADLRNQLKQARESGAKWKAKAGQGSVKSGGASSAKGKREPRCTVCGESGHWLQDCPQLSEEQRKKSKAAREKMSSARKA